MLRITFGTNALLVTCFFNHQTQYVSRIPFIRIGCFSVSLAASPDDRAAYNRLRIRPRVLRDVSTVDTTVNVLGAELRSPICIAPTGTV